MALIPCPECQHEISTLAAYCPNCGYVLNLQLLSLSKDLELVRLVERERQRRAMAPYLIALAVILLFLCLVALAINVALSHPTPVLRP